MTLGPFTQWSRAEIKRRRQAMEAGTPRSKGKAPTAPVGLEQRLYDRAYWTAWGYPLPVEPTESHHPEKLTIPGYICAQCSEPWIIVAVDMAHPPDRWTPPLNQVCYTEVPSCDCGFNSPVP
jgi:hypothetical protein